MPFPFSRRNSNSVVAERRSPAAPRPASLFSLSDWALFDLPAPKPKPAPATTASSPARPQLQPLPENHSYTLTAADTAFHTPTPRRRTQSAAPRPMSAYTTALPPGAAEPVLVRPQWHTFNSYSAGCTRNAPAASTFARSTTFDRLDAPLPSDRSARRDLGLGQSHYTKRSAMADVQGSRLPVVPPRSHLRPSATTSLSSSSSSPSSSAPSSSTASPLPSRSSSLARSTNKSASSVEVHTPSPPSTPLTARHFNVSSPMGGHNSNTDFGPKLGSHEHEVIQFSQPVRKRNFAGSVSSVDRDPFKVRDGLQSRKASSGVYTPHTFPGPSVPTQQSRQNQPFPTTSPTNSTFPHDSSSQQRHKQAHRVRSLGSFQRFSMHLHNRETEPVPPPMPISNPRSSYHPHTQYVAHSKPSYSPTSARSGGSMSPPDTPTTPTSVNIVGHHSATARPVVIMSNDFGPGVDFSRSPVESTGLGLGLEDTKLDPAAPITPSYILRSSNQPPQLPPIDASPSALPSQPVAPKISPAPKRGRRKPVPRLDEDVLETLETAETARTDLRPHAL